MGKRSRRASSTFSQAHRSEKTLPVPKKRDRKGKGDSFGETSVRLPSKEAQHKRTVRISSTNDYYRDSHLRDQKDKERDLLATGKQVSSTKKASKLDISRHELADLDITPESQQQGPRRTRNHKRNLDNLNNNVNHNNGDDKQRSQVNRSRRCPPDPAIKRPRLIINSNPFTPSPPGSPKPTRHRKMNKIIVDDEVEDEDYNESPPSSRKNNTKQKMTASENNRHVSTRLQSHQARNPQNLSSSPASSTQASTSIASASSAVVATPASASKRSSAAKNRTYTFPVAGTLSTANEADKVMFRMKSEGKSWKEITAAWGRITGRVPGASSLSVRYIKLKDRFAKMGDVDVSVFAFPLCVYNQRLAELLFLVPCFANLSSDVFLGLHMLTRGTLFLFIWSKKGVHVDGPSLSRFRTFNQNVRCLTDVFHSSTVHPPLTA